MKTNSSLLSGCKTLRHRAGFSLVELLVVIATIALLAAILLPALAAVKKKAQSISCLNNVRQLDFGVKMYSADFNSHYPPRSETDRWPNQIYGNYLKNLNVLLCPSDTNNAPLSSNPGDTNGPDIAPRSYIINGWNDYFEGRTDPTGMNTNDSISESAIFDPSTTIMFGEKKSHFGDFYMDINGNGANNFGVTDQSRHVGRSNYGFVDGHAVSIKAPGAVSPRNRWAVGSADQIWYSLNF